MNSLPPPVHGRELGKVFTRTAERTVYLLAALCGLVFLYLQVGSYTALRAARSLTPQRTVSQVLKVNYRSNSSDRAARTDVIGRLDIPELALSVPIISDYDPSSLRKGIGYIPGTARPGGLGNMGLAGHRDTFFRPLRKIRIGTAMDVVVAEGKYKYVVDSTEIVDPDDVQVLDIGSRPEMTLITCYPFEFIGAAPQRFIVHAHLLSVGPI